MISSLQCYKIYVGLKLHFNNPNYDFIKFNGHTRVTRNSFESRSDKGYYINVSRKYDSIDKVTKLFVANFVHQPNSWIGDFLQQKFENRYLDFIKREQSRMYIMEQELYDLDKSWFKITEGQNPKILENCYSGEVGYDVLVIMNKYLKGLFDYFDKNLDDKIVWPKLKHSILKYEPFVKHDKHQCLEFFQRKSLTK